MKNTQKIALAEQVVAHARSLGFEDAHLQFCNDDGDLFDTLEEFAEDHGVDEDVIATIAIVLDQDLAFTLVEDPDDEDAEPRIQFAK